jgi:hypothetical protein
MWGKSYCLLYYTEQMHVVGSMRSYCWLNLAIHVVTTSLWRVKHRVMMTYSSTQSYPVFARGKWMNNSGWPVLWALLDDVTVRMQVCCCVQGKVQPGSKSWNVRNRAKTTNLWHYSVLQQLGAAQSFVLQHTQRNKRMLANGSEFKPDRKK